MESNIGSLQMVSQQQLVPEILQRVGEGRKLKNVFPSAPNELTVFIEGNTIKVDLINGDTIQDRYVPRGFLYEINFLHLNHPKKLWTGLADLYAVALALLALSGLFILRGKQGLKGRGGILTIVGFIIPVFFLWLYL